MGEIQLQLGALFGPTKRICAGENFFAWDSALLRLSPIRFVHEVEGRCLAMSNVRKLRAQIRAIVWRCSPESFPCPFSTAPCSRRNSDETLQAFNQKHDPSRVVGGSSIPAPTIAPPPACL
jgi:hypothetical protein